MTMVSTNSPGQPPPSIPDPPATVLVVASETSIAADAACAELVGGGSPVAESAILVSLHESPDQRLDVLRRHGGDLPGEITVVTGGGEMRSATAPGVDSDPAVRADGDVRANVVSVPGTVTGIGRHIGRTLSSWTDEDTRGRMCFHSVSELLQLVDLRTAFRLLHVVTRHAHTANAIGHFHLDPDRHDTETLHTIGPIFDSVIEFENGDWIRSNRY